MSSGVITIWMRGGGRYGKKKYTLPREEIRVRVLETAPGGTPTGVLVILLGGPEITIPVDAMDQKIFAEFWDDILADVDTDVLWDYVENRTEISESDVRAAEFNGAIAPAGGHRELPRYFIEDRSQLVTDWSSPMQPRYFRVRHGWTRSETRS